MVSIALREHFDDYAPFLAGAQDRVDRREVRLETHVDDTPADGNYGTAVRAFCGR
jgi:hypothetical protein